MAGRDTNSNNASSLRCRVFVGNLATDKVTKQEVEDLFSKFGRVASISLHNNFGFVQFDKENAADEAVLEMHGTTLHEKRIDVNLAGVRRKPQSKDKFEGAPKVDEVVPPTMLNSGAPAKRMRSRSPHRPPPRSLSPMSRYEELYKRDDPYGRDRYGRGFFEDGPTYDQPPRREYAPDPYHLDRREEAFAPTRYDYAPPAEDYYRRPPPPEVRQRPVRPEVDCEILSVSKEESRYADEVESRLRSIGLACNIGYPREDVPLVEALDHVARCGTLYAVVVSDQNAQHRSCTLNILHGPRQEHRNMPLDDALSFVARNFDAYLRVLREPVAPYRAPPPAHVYPRDEYARVARPTHSEAAMKPLETDVVKKAADEKKLSTDELNAMIEKLKREKEARESLQAASTSKESVVKTDVNGA